MPAFRHLVALSVILASMPWAFGAELATVPATLMILPEERSYAGRIEAVNQATVAAETRGRIEEIRVDIGDSVPAGTVILTVTSTEQRASLSQAEAALAEAQANLTAETAEFARINELFTRQFVSKADVDRATARLNGAKARVSSAEAALKTAREQLSYTEVRAPFGGVVSARHVEPGEMVQPGSLLLTGYDPNNLRVEVDLPQNVAERVREIGEARIVSYALNNAPVASITPEKLILYPIADAATSTVRARMDLPAGSAGLHPGQFVKALMKVGESESLLIPASSLVQRAELSAVYVVKDGLPQLRQIRPGARVVTEAGDQLIVLAGLRPGELIATDPVAAAIALTSARN